MAVYTEVDAAETAALFARLGLGAPQSLAGIGAGIENTNYFATTADGRHWVLTLFERLSADELPYYLQLMAHLAHAGLPVPLPQADREGGYVHRLAGKPAAVVSRLPGEHRWQPAADHAAQLGRALARMHRAAADAPLAQPNPRGWRWCEATAAEVLPRLDGDAATLLREELAFQRAFEDSKEAAALPRGPVHGDLFRDNVLFDTGPDGGDRLCGLFDFYFAGTDRLLLDVAVCLNDWCTDDATAALDEHLAGALVQGYEGVRALTPAERAALPALLRAAALRFWLSRLHDWHWPRPAALLQPKDPRQFERVLRQRAAVADGGVLR